MQSRVSGKDSDTMSRFVLAKTLGPVGYIYISQCDHRSPVICSLGTRSNSSTLICVYTSTAICSWSVRSSLQTASKSSSRENVTSFNSISGTYRETQFLNIFPFTIMKRTKSPVNETTSLLSDRPDTFSYTRDAQYSDSSGSNDGTRRNSQELFLEDANTQHNLNLNKVPILVSLWLGSFLSSLDSTIVANIMNKVAEQFGESQNKQWIATSYLLTNTAFQPLYGKLSDIIGRKIALLLALAFFGVGCVMTAFANNVTQFAIARAVCGIGGGGITAMSSITVGDICDVKDRGVYQGYANVIFGFGQLLGAPLGGLLIDTIGWRAIFGIQVPMALISMILGYSFVNIKLSHVLPREERYTLENLSRLDFLGSLTLVLSITCAITMLSTTWNILVMSATTLAFFCAFLYVELYVTKEQIIPIALLKGPFGYASLATVISSYIVFGEIFRSPIYLQVVQNFSVTTTGFFLIFPSIFLSIGSLITGVILKKTTRDLEHCSYNLIFAGIILQVCGLIISFALLKNVEPNLAPATEGQVARILAISSTSFSWKVIFVIGVSSVAFGYSTLLVATLVSIVYTVDKSQQATITGLFYLWRSLGTVLGTSLTLITYENSLMFRLWEFMFNKDGRYNNDTGYKFTANEYKTIIGDSSYLRKHFPYEVTKELLEVYKDAFFISYLPNIALGIFGIASAWLLTRTLTKTKMNSISMH